MDGLKRLLSGIKAEIKKKAKEDRKAWSKLMRGVEFEIRLLDW